MSQIMELALGKPGCKHNLIIWHRLFSLLSIQENKGIVEKCDISPYVNNLHTNSERISFTGDKCCCPIYITIYKHNVSPW